MADITGVLSATPPSVNPKDVQKFEQWAQTEN